MKKLFTLLLTLLMLVSLVGCNSKEDTPVVQEPEKQEVVEPVQEEIAGGYVDVEDGTLTDELKDIFTKALEGLVGATYEPQKLIATQVVAGTNYKFLAKGSKTTNPVTKGTYYITIYKDLEGKIELKDIEVIEEKQDKVSEDVLKTYNYWVVVYDQFDNEISRDAIKYGTTVKDPDGNDVVVNGNKYFHTYIDYSPKNNDSSSATTCIVKFEWGTNLGEEVGELRNANEEKVTEISVPSGTTFTTDGNTITIGENVFTAVAHSGFTFHSFNPSSGSITAATTILVDFSQDQPQ